MKKILTILLILLTTGVAYSQNYPIQSNINITPPYSVYLSDYASMTSNKLMVNMMLKDPMEPNVNITLRITIKGNGIELRTRDDYRPQAIQLDGGVPLIISGSELESYLNPANLSFSGISKTEFMKTGKLPEGVYQFFVEAMSFDRPGIVLSNQGMAVAWLVLNDPPHWTLPMQNSFLTATYPQFVNFSWMPMNTGSPNAAFTTEYEFTIVELWPEDRAPGDAINSFSPLYQTTTSNTSLVYGPAEPELTPGRKYVCRLRTYDTEGRDLFKNNGYSELLVFTFGQACMPPNTFNHNIISPEEARVDWTSLPGNSQFILSYSEQNTDGTWSNWYHNEGIMPYSIIKSLKPEHNYRYQLKAICGTLESEYSDIQEFITPAADTTQLECGKDFSTPDVDDSPPLPTLRIGDRINAAGFTAVVTEAEGSNGTFSGKCILFVKTFGHAPIYSEFDNIGVNQSMQLTSGSIKSVMGELNIIGLDGILASNDDDNDNNNNDGNGDPNVGDPYEDGDSIIVVLGGEDFIVTGDTTIITAGGDTITTDFSQIPPIIIVNGDSTNITTDELDFDNPGGGSGGDGELASTVSDTSAYAITLVEFKPFKKQLFGFDQYPDDIPEFRADYSTETVNEKGYKVHWKSNQSFGLPDKVIMELSGRDGEPVEPPDSILTRLTIESSVTGPLSFSMNPEDSTWVVQLNGQSHENEDHIIAYYTQDDGTKIAVGHLNMVSYNKQDMRLIIVPVNNDYSLEAHALKDSLDNIYKGAITYWDVSVVKPLEVDFEENETVGLDTEMADMAAYTKEMRNIRNAMKRREDFDGKAQYLFLVDKSEKGEKNGIMPFRRRYGFIFMENQGNLKGNKEKLFHTIAHELGHGPFGLEHPWQEKGTTEGGTYNLMDYSNKKPNNLLRKYQWHYIHNPKSSWFGGDEEEVSSTYKGIREFSFINKKAYEASKGYYVSPSGCPIYIPQKHIAYFESNWPEQIPKGALIGYKIDNVLYAASYYSRDDGKTPFMFNNYWNIRQVSSNPTQVKQTPYVNKGDKSYPFKRVRVNIDGMIYIISLGRDSKKEGFPDNPKGEITKAPYHLLEQRLLLEDVLSDKNMVDGTYKYITPAGKVIQIEGKQKAFFLNPDARLDSYDDYEGVLYAFVNNGRYYVSYIKDDENFLTNDIFLGYYDLMDDIRYSNNMTYWGLSNHKPNKNTWYHSSYIEPINGKYKDITYSTTNDAKDRRSVVIDEEVLNSDYLPLNEHHGAGYGRLSRVDFDDAKVDTKINPNATLIIINSVTRSNYIHKVLKEKKDRIEKLTFINNEWGKWNAPWKWQKQKNQVSNPYEWISKRPILGENEKLDEYFKKNRKFNLTTGERNGIPNNVIELKRKGNIHQNGLAIWGAYYADDDKNLKYGLIDYVPGVDKMPLHKSKQLILDFYAQNGLPIIMGDKASLALATLKNLGETSKTLSKVLTVGGSVEAKAGVGFASAGLIVASNYAADQKGNLSIVVSSVAYAPFFGAGWSNGLFSDQSWYIGWDLGISADAAYRIEKEFIHVRDLAGIERSFDIDFLPYGDISFLFTKNNDFTGVELSGGISFSGGVGWSNVKSEVLAFTPEECDKIIKSVEEGEQILKTYNNSEIKKNEGYRYYGYLALKKMPTAEDFELCYNITEVPTSMLAFVESDFRFYKQVKSTPIINFKYDKSYYYKTKNVEK